MKEECCDQIIRDASKRANETGHQSVAGRRLRSNSGDERAGVPSLDVSDGPGRYALFGPKQPVRPLPGNNMPGQFAIPGVPRQRRTSPTGISDRGCGPQARLYRVL